MSHSTPTTDDILVYAVGDIHGRTDAFCQLLGLVADDARLTAPSKRPSLILLGDYVDRGPDSRGTLDVILATQAAGLFDVVALRGNHEDAMLKVLDDPGFAETWVSNWGRATLASYGVQGWTDAAAARDLFAAAVPATHRAFLESLPLSLRIGDYLFVHAGVRPGVALDAQADRDLMWIRYDFLDSEADHGVMVVHGHTPTAEPVVRQNRIGIDTGVYASGTLTAVRLEGTTRRFLQARAAPDPNWY